MTTNENPVRECALAILAAIDRCGDDAAALREAIADPVGKLLSRDDLDRLGVPRQGNNVASSQYLYFDGQLSILLFELPKDQPVPPHDHGVWEAFCVYRGRVGHTVFERVDDESVPGKAELSTVADQVLGPGDIAVVAPPADIHGFTALETGTMGLTVVCGAYKDERHYYRPESGTYEVRTQANRH